MENIENEPKIKKRKAVFIVSCVLTFISVLVLSVYLLATGISFKMLLADNPVAILSGILFYIYFFVIAIIGLPLTIAAFVCSIISIGSKIKGIKITAIILSVVNSAQLIVYILSVLYLTQILGQ